MEDFTLHPQLAKDSLLLDEWTLCSLRLINNAHLPWFILVPRRSQIREPYQLCKEDQTRLWYESGCLSEALMTKFKGDKLNLAAIGNQVPQLHLHHVVRYKQDICWPQPIWGQLSGKPYTSQRLSEIRNWAIDCLAECRK